MAKSNFIVRGGADFSGIKQEIDKTQKQFKGFKSNISGTLKTIGKLTGLAIGAKALVDFGKQSIQVASDLTEVQNVVDVTFGSMAKEVNEFASSATKEFGLSELSAKKFTSTMGAMLKSSGLTGQAVTDMSIEMAKLTADMASFYNLDAETAFQKIRSGISGETEPLKQLGINMSVANMEAYALSQGINTAWREMTQAEQTMLRYNYLLSVTGDAQGDFSRNTGTWANQVKILKEQWQELMGLIGEALIKILLPVVKFLNKVLDVLIKIANAIGQIYSMITGKEVKAESSNNIADGNMDIADTAIDAADGEGKLADGIGKAAKAAKKALAPFDELNILQQNLGSGGGGTIGGGLGDLLNTGELNTTISTTKVDAGFEEAKEEGNKFFIWLTDKWNRLKELLSQPIRVPAPIFASIPSPIYNPDWGLEIPKIPAPVFSPIPVPVYDVDWGLEPPAVPAPIFPPIPSPVYEPVWNLIPPPVPAVDYKEYANSLERMKIKTTEITEGIKISVVTGYEKMKQGALEHTEKLRQGQSELWEKVRTDTGTVTGRIQTGLSGAWSTVETNFKTHKENVGKIAGEISTTLVTNINTGLSTMGTNFNKIIETVQTNLQTFGKNVGAIAGEAARTFSANFSEGFKTTSQNIVSFANAAGQNIKSFGEGMLRIGAETARGFASNMASGLSTAWENFKNLMSSIGEKVSGWFSANKEVIVKTAVTGLVVGGGVALAAMAAPVAIPFAAKALGGLAAVAPIALATGGITGANQPFHAIVGDNKTQREVISPLDDLMSMIQTAVSETGGNGGDTTIIVKIGEDTITEKVISNINRQNRISGETVIQV